MNSQQLRQRIGELDGGELVGAWGPYQISFPPERTHTLVYTTKPHAAYHLLAFDEGRATVGTIGRYGLPQEHDIEGIARVARDHILYFLGDCDPFDLLVFAWLRQHFLIRFLGTSDAVIAALGVDMNDRITIPFSDDERRAMLLVREIWPDFVDSVGATCARLLDGGRKLELEALASFHTSPARNLLCLMQESA